MNVPGSRAVYLEHLDAGVLACALLRCHSSRLPLCADLIHACQHANGGYARSVYGGIATLENTYYAVRSLECLFHIQQGYPLNRRKQRITWG